MKKYFTIIVLAFFTLKAIAQDTIPNPSFERWTSGTGYMDPTGWVTPNSISITEGGSAEVTQSTDTVYSGSYAARLETKSILGGLYNVPGALLLGSIDIIHEKISGGVPFSKRPLALYGYYQYVPASGKTDSCLVFIIIKKHNSSNGNTDTVAEGEFVGAATAGAYTHFVVPINYFTGEIPDTIQVAVASSYKFLTSPPIGSVMFVDSLTFSSDTSAAGINTLTGKDFSVSCYPNPAKSNLNISISKPKAGMIIKVYDVLGRDLLSVNTTGLTTTIDVSNFSTGAYFYEVIDAEGNELKSEKFTVVR